MKPSKKDFIAEAEEIIENIGSSTLELQNKFNPDTLNAIFRAIHTMKGHAGLFGMKGITEFSHVFESLLDDLRLGKIELTDDTINFILNNIDILKNLIAQVAEDSEIEDVKDAVTEIEAFRQKAKSRDNDISIEDIGVSPSIIKVLTEYEEHRLKSNFTKGKGIYLIKTIFELASFVPGLETLNYDLNSLGEIIATLPSSEGAPEGSIGFNLLLGTSLTIDDIESKISAGDIEQIVSPKAISTPTSVTELLKPKGVSYKSATNIVRVDIDKLDRILNTISELILAKGAVVRIGQELAEALGYTPLTIDVHKIAQTLDRKLAELQNHVLELRMVPFSQIFAKLTQVVTRHTRDVGKEIDLKLFGEDTEIDKQIAEEIIDPLIHIIRNTIDHGIEPGKERLSLGKSERGNVILKAFSRGNNVMVTIEDDGAGLDIDKILRKAVEKKIIPENHGLARNEIINLTFLPGLSTKEGVSEISGRGVGMDVVKEKITSFGGFVDIETESGAGTTIILTLPITLALVKTLIVEVANEYFAIPLTSITETFIIDPKEIQTVEGREVIEIRKEMLPLLRVARVFMLEERQKEEYFGVTVSFGERRLGLLADALLEQADIVIKPLGEHLKNIHGISGAAEIGRHEIVLVLDVEDMMEEAFSRKRVTV